MASQLDTIRIVIADDHPIVREGLRRLLDAEPGFVVVGEASDGELALECVARLDPDVLLLDLAMPRLAGMEVLARLTRGHEKTRVVILTAVIESGEVVRAFQLGARGVVLKESATQHLYQCIRRVMAGEYWLGWEGVQDIVQGLRQLSGSLPPEPAPMAQLTPRELQVVAAVMEGASNQEIAEQFGLSPQTVKNHLTAIFDKLGVSSRLELALFAVHHRLLASKSPDR